MVIVLQFVFGLVLLVLGAELLVRSASAIARSFGIAPVVIGLTVVAIGTSSPELAISITSALTGEGDIALGNVVGSNIANVLLILGISALILPIAVNRQLVRLDVPVMIGVSAAITAWAFVVGGFGRAMGVVLLLAFVLYVGLLLWMSRRKVNKAAEEAGQPDRELAETQTKSAERPAGRSRSRPIWVYLLVLAAGIAVMILGSSWLVESASAIARALGVSELVIGLTIVAFGTSSPELATSLVAAFRKKGDLAVGNVVGSNIMNLLLVLGATAALSPSPIAVPEHALRVDLPVMLTVAVVCLPVFFTQFTVRRWEGALLFGSYIAYTGYLLLEATGSAALQPYTSLVIWALLPLFAVTLTVSLWFELRARRRSGDGPRTSAG